MGEIAAAIFTTHVPRLMITDLAARKAYMGRNVTTFYDAMPKLERERLHSLDFDTFALVDSHWFTTLEYVLNAHERLTGSYTSEELPEMLHDLEYDYAGDPELARAVETAGRARGIRVLASAHRNLPLHYPTLNVMYYFNRDARRRVLSIGVCQTASVANDLAFGAALGDAIRNSNRRVVLIASGGMSHRFWDYDHILEHASASPDDISSTGNRLYDERIMEWFKAGRHADVVASAADYRAHCAPEGRFSHYLVMAGALGAERWDWRGEQFGAYEAAIGTGQSIFFFAPAAANPHA
jgi:3,4-dihydroxyphenylacetate 2,3-dioxygenase